MNNLGYEQDSSISSKRIPNVSNTPNWVYDSNYWYWTMSYCEDSHKMWFVHYDGNMYNDGRSNNNMVRPVLELNKSADITKLD